MNETILEPSDIALIKWFKFSNEELQFLIDALDRHPDQKGTTWVRLRNEILRVLTMRHQTP